MKKFEKNIKIGTKVFLYPDVCDYVKSFEHGRQWVTLENHAGSFQRGHIIKYTNKKDNK